MQAKITTRLVKSLAPQIEPYEIFDTELTGFILRVQPSGHMSYYLAYRTPEGHRGRLRLGRADALSVAQARDLALKHAARVIAGEDIQAARQKAREEVQNARLQTLGGFLEHKYGPWLRAERPEKRRSVETLQRLQANFAALLDRPMVEISPWIIEKWRAEQRKCGKAQSTINRDFTVLRTVLSKAVLWKVLASHPLESLKPLKVDIAGRLRYLTLEEEARLRDALHQRDAEIKAARARGNAWRRGRGYAELPTLEKHRYSDHLTPMVLLALNTGMRRGELFSVCWADVNFQTKTLTVRGKTAKSGQTRYIPLNSEALQVLMVWYQQTLREGLVFPGKKGGRLDNVRKAWARVLKAADIRGFRWHDLRHTFASKLVMAGVPLNTVRELLGHTTPAMTLRYAHLAPDHKASAVEQLCPVESLRGELVMLGGV
jgi:integrase